MKFPHKLGAYPSVTLKLAYAPSLRIQQWGVVSLSTLCDIRVVNKLTVIMRDSRKTYAN